MGYFIQQQFTLSSKTRMELSPRQAMFWAIKHALTDIKEHNHALSALRHRGIKLETNNRKIIGKCQNTWRLNNIPINNTWTKEELLREIWKYFELSKNENPACQTLWDTVKAMLEGNWQYQKPILEKKKDLKSFIQVSTLGN